MTYVEIIAALFGFMCVYFFIVRNHWSWPTGFVQVVLLIAVFLQAKLYADMVLHVVYAVLQLYGWWAWWRSTQPRSTGIAEEAATSTEIRVRVLSKWDHAICITLGLAMTAVFAFLLRNYTNAASPILDSFVAAMSLVAQFLLAWRYLENWCYWIVVDVVGVGLFASKLLYPTTALYVLFMVMAIVGYLSWRRTYHAQLRREVVAA